MEYFSLINIRQSHSARLARERISEDGYKSHPLLASCGLGGSGHRPACSLEYAQDGTLIAWPPIVTTRKEEAVATSSAVL